MNSGEKPSDAFAYFTEISIIDQLCTSLIGKVLPGGVHPSHFAIIVHLVRRGDGKTPLSIASAMQVTKATMSHSIKVLEKHGFIETAPCESDARSKLVFLTEAGHAFYVDAMNAAARTFGHFLRDEHQKIMAEALPGLVAMRKLLDDNRQPVSEDGSPPEGS